MKSQKSIKRTLISMLILIVGVLTFGIAVYASNMNYIDVVARYENSNEFSMNSSNASSKFAFGKQSIGRLFMNGNAKAGSSINDVKVYEVNGVISFGYSYDGDYQTSVKENWNLYSSPLKQLGDIKLSKRVDKGLVLIQKSNDGVNWETADAKYNFFVKNKSGSDSLYTVTQEEIKAGTYYRVYVAYSMQKKTGVEKALIGTKDVFEIKNFVEEYKFFVCYDTNPVKTFDLTSRKEVADKGNVENGFIIDTAGANAKVSVKRDGMSISNDAISLTTYSTPGVYSITALSPTGRTYQKVVTVKTGISLSEVNPSIYSIQDSKDYSTATVDPVMPAISTLKIGQKAGSESYKSSKNGFTAYGVTGNMVTFYLKLKDESSYASNGWKVESDTYGKKEKQLIESAKTGQIDTGALVIQTSKNGTDWVNVDLGRYANGLYTTDFTKNYSGLGDVFIYSPDGQDVISGVYVRILYAYKAKEVNGKTKKRCVEEYKFYLCSNELGAVTFPNLSVTEETIKKCGVDGDIDAEMRKSSQTLTSGSVTTSGFKIDNSLNPTVTFSVKRNGAKVSIPSNHQFTETGKYDIELKSAVGATRSVVIYVDRLNESDALKMYFGDGFIQGKRIYSDSEYPVFEGGLTKYNIESVDAYFLPVYGFIENTTTGEKIDISASRGAKSGDITAPGEYVAVLSNNPTYKTDNVSGDNRVITFRFAIIEKGTAPGPVNNQKNLIAANRNNVSGSYPVFYGLTYPSAGSGYITKAYATREAAIQAAYTFEKGMVEIQSDGSYRYTGSFKVAKKEKFDSAWDLTDAEYYFAEQAVQVMYFDLSDEFTYLTLNDETIAKYSNLRTLEIERSVTIYGDEEQKEALTSLNALPIINALPYSYLTDKNTKKPVSGNTDFMFIKDKYGCDSNSVVITDCNGKEYCIQYNKGVAMQLSEQNCPTGVVTITESTIYGDTVSYNAIYFADRDITAQLTVSYFSNGQQKKTSYSQKSSDEVIIADFFLIESLKDDLDPYDLVIIDGPAGVYAYSADQLDKAAWADEGEYTITVLNRIGNKYSIKVVVGESNYATVSFKGEDTEKLATIIAKYGDSQVDLPVIEKAGYTLIGFEDDEGNLYQKAIAKIDFKGSKELHPVWKANQHTLTLLNSDGTQMSVTTVNYGAEYELPVLENKDDEIFVGWISEDEEIYKEKIMISSDKDYVLKALYQEANSEIDETGENNAIDITSATSVNNENNEINTPGVKINVRAVLIVASIIAILSGGTILIMQIRLRKENAIVSAEEKETSDEEDN